jgi:outer membrane protein, heavy metal efflux system
MEAIAEPPCPAGDCSSGRTVRFRIILFGKARARLLHELRSTRARKFLASRSNPMHSHSFRFLVPHPALGPMSEAKSVSAGPGRLHREPLAAGPGFALVLAILIALAPRPARAQGPRRISLDDAIRLALQHNPSLAAAQTLLPQSRAQEVTANLRPNPVLQADALFLPIFDPSGFNSETLNTASEFDLGVSYLFERGKKRQHRLRAARDQTAITSSQVTDAERTLTFDVAQQFTGVLLAESNLELARQDLDDFQKTVEIGAARYKSGEISEGDFLKIKLQLLQFQTDVSSAQLARMQALIGLRQLLGYRSVPADYDVAGQLAYQPLSADLEQLKLLALQSRPDLRAARLGVQAAESQHELAKANGKRDLTMWFNYTHVSALNTGSAFWSIQMPIFDRNQGEIARTRYAIEQARDLSTASTEQVLSDVGNAYQSVQSNGQVVKLYESGYLKEAKQSLDISRYAYERGAASLLDLLDAARSYRATQLAYRQALTSYMLAMEQLREAVGKRNLP